MGSFINDVTLKLSLKNDNFPCHVLAFFNPGHVTSFMNAHLRFINFQAYDGCAGAPSSFREDGSACFSAQEWKSQGRNPYSAPKHAQPVSFIHANSSNL